MGMFDKFTRSMAQSAPAEEPPMVLAQGVMGATKATPEQTARAVARLRAAGIKPNAVNVAEEIANEVGGADAAPAGPVVPGAGRAGAQGSPEMLERIKEQQRIENAARIKAALEERRRMSGAR
jgi:hypothetical protein